MDLSLDLLTLGFLHLLVQTSLVRQTLFYLSPIAMHRIVLECLAPPSKENEEDVAESEGVDDEEHGKPQELEVQSEYGWGRRLTSSK